MDEEGTRANLQNGSQLAPVLHVIESYTVTYQVREAGPPRDGTRRLSNVVLPGDSARYPNEPHWTHVRDAGSVWSCQHLLIYRSRSQKVEPLTREESLYRCGLWSVSPNPEACSTVRVLTGSTEHENLLVPFDLVDDPPGAGKGGVEIVIRRDPEAASAGALRSQ